MQKKMYLFGLLLCFITAYTAQAQIVTMPTSGAGPIQTSCTGTLLDSGGNGDYTNNVNSTITIMPNAPSVSVSFSEFALETCCDHVILYDGTSTDSPMIIDLQSNPGNEIFSSTGSAITVEFTTDGSVVNTGFVMNWEVQGAGLDATFLPSDANPPANIPVLFVSNASCASFAWNFGDGTTSTESSPEHTFTAPGTYNVSLVVTNDVGETDSYSTQVTVQDFADISATPGSFSTTLASGDSLTAPLTITNNGDGPLIFNIDGASLLADKGVNVVAITNTASVDYSKAITAINTYYTDYSLQEVQPTSAAALSAAIINADVVFIPEQTIDVDVALFASFAPVLNDFVTGGGTVLFTGANESGYIFATDLFDGSHTDAAVTTAPLTVLLPEDLLMDNITGTYSVQATTFLYDFTNPDIVRVAVSGTNQDVIAYRNIGEGKAIFIGHDYRFSGPSMKQVIANAIRNAGGGDVSWIYLSEISGTLAPGESITINVELNANYVCGGSYEQNLVIHSNDPDQPDITIPCSLEITGTPSYGASANSFNFGEIQQFDTQTQTLFINNPGTYELNVEIVSSNGAFTASPSSFTVPGCNGIQAVQLTFAPVEVQTYNATLSIQTNVAPFPFTIPLSGNSVGAPITAVTPTPIEVSVMTGETTTQNITVSNTGIGPLIYSIDTANFAPNLDILIYTGANVSPQDIVVINTVLSDNFSGGFTAANTPADPSSSQLNIALAGKEVLIIPNILFVNIQLFNGYEAVLQDFLNNGGTILFFGSNSGVLPALETNIFDGNTSFDTGNPYEILEPNHPFMVGVGDNYSSGGTASILSINSDAQVIMTQNTFGGEPAATIATRQIGEGNAIYFGSTNFGFPSQHDQLVFKNIISWIKNTQLASWLDINSAVSNVTVNANSTGTIEASFNSGNLLGGVYTTELIITTNDPVQPTITIPVIMTVVGVPQISVDALSLDYGSLVIGDVQSQTITITNPGTDNLIISNISAGNAAYTLSDASFNIPPFGSETLTVTFTPTAIQDYASNLVLTNNVGDITIALTGQGQGAPISSVSTTNITVELTAGTSSNQSISINNAAAAAGVLDWSIDTETIPAWLSVSPLSGTNNAGQNIALNVTLNSTGLATGVYTYTLVINTNDPLHTTYSVVCTMNVIDIPQAQFTANTTLACGPDAVVFTDNTLNVATSWQWDFGDGSTSTAQNPTHAYTSNGTYTVTLEACNSLGCDTQVMSNYITVDLNCASIVLPISGASSTNECNGVIKDDGGDGQYANGVNTTFTIAPVGAVNIVLSFSEFAVETCCDDLAIYDGASVASPLIGIFTSNPGTITSSGDALTLVWNTDGSIVYSGFEAAWQCTIINEVPNTNFSFDITDACVGEVEFTDISTNFPNSFTWNFGDGTTSTQADPVHNYEQNGTYNVTLTACNIVGCDEITIPVTISDVFGVNPTVPQCGNVGTPVLLVGTTVGASSYQWNFGDGDVASGTSTPIHIYDAPGTYTVTLTVTGGACQRIITRVITILPAGQICTVSTQNPTLDANIAIAPNPTKGVFALQYNFVGNKSLSVRVYDAIGHEVIRREAQAIGGYHADIDLSTYASGLYFVAITTPEGTITKRVMLQ